MRIKHAALDDPLVAVNGSDVDPLPYQIRAVYEELLPSARTRVNANAVKELGFLLFHQAEKKNAKDTILLNGLVSHG